MTTLRQAAYELVGSLVEGLGAFGGPVGLGKNTENSVSMTAATELYWGSSGRGNPRAVARIRAAADLGFVRLVKNGRATYVSLTDKGLKLYSEEKAKETQS